MLEKYLITHCSPTLASLKTANLFRVHISPEELEEQLSGWNRKLNPKGIALYALRERDNEALIYVCRRARLREDLCKPGIARFLESYGYTHAGADAALERLRERLAAQGVHEDFPHEIGIFLGYPLGDVEGFIRHGGRGCKCSGCWKVYCDECEARKTFAKFRKCRDIYTRLWSQGRSVCQLAVAA